MPRRLIRPNLDTLTGVFYNGYYKNIYYILHDEKRVICSHKLEKDIENYIQKVRDIYVPSVSKG